MLRRVTFTARTASAVAVAASRAPCHSAPMQVAAFRQPSSAQREILAAACSQNKIAPEQTQQLLERWAKRVDEFDAVTLVLLALSVVNVCVTYFIIFDWIYQGHVELWDGTYGVDDEDDDEDDE